MDLELEVADTELEHWQGLSGRPYLPAGSGMIFVFDKPFQPSFWMKDMQFPLDFIWMDENFRIVDLTPDVAPESYPTIFKPSEPVQYVLEVNAGFAEREELKIGDTLALPVDL